MGKFTLMAFPASLSHGSILNRVGNKNKLQIIMPQLSNVTHLTYHGCDSCLRGDANTTCLILES